MDIQDALDFVALASSRSFSKAASQRHVTQPAFSRRLRALELELRLDLVDRSCTPLALTPAGQQFLRHAQNMLKAYDFARQDMQALTTNLPEAVHIQTGRSMANAYFPPWYQAMRRQIKGLSMRLTHAQGTVRSLNNLRAGLADFVIQLATCEVARNDDYSGLQTKQIGRERLLFVRKADTPENALIAYHPHSYMQALTTHLLRPHKEHKLAIAFESPATEFTRGLVLVGIGCALLPETLIATELKSGQLVPAFAHIKPLAATISLVRAQHALSKQAEAVWAKAGGPSTSP